MSLFGRISNRIKMTTKSFRSDSRFSRQYAWLRVREELGGRLRLTGMSQKAYEERAEWISNYLEKTNATALDAARQPQHCGEYAPSAPIWVCWWTGEETAPALVKQCLKSIRRNAGNHPVHMITEQNYGEYLDIPDYILRKLNDGSMCVANFSDYLRFSLLAKYGGLWLDATIYCAAPIPESYFEMPLFTCKGRVGPGRYISDYRWTSFCFGGHRGHVLFRFMQNAFDAYWQQNDVSIDYLLVDHTIKLGYDKVPAIHDALDAVPVTNPHRDDLAAAMNAGLQASAFDSVIQPDTVLYKLSWRESYPETTAAGEQSIFLTFIKS